MCDTITAGGSDAWLIFCLVRYVYSRPLHTYMSSPWLDVHKVFANATTDQQLSGHAQSVQAAAYRTANPTLVTCT